MKRSHIAIIAIVGIAAVLGAVVVAWQLSKLSFAGGMDARFGAQHLKTTVALVELHKVRYGSYPAQLSDLKFLGDWDPIAVNNVLYAVNGDRTRYCVSVQRGWIGKPKLEMPDEFWRGTGYDAALCR